MPSLKEKQRYLAYEALSDTSLDVNDISYKLHESLLRWMGEVEYGAAGVQLMNLENGKGIIRVNSTHVDKVRSGLAVIQEIREKKAVFRSMGVSGMLTKAKRMLE